MSWRIILFLLNIGKQSIKTKLGSSIYGVKQASKEASSKARSAVRAEPVVVEFHTDPVRVRVEQ